MKNRCLRLSRSRKKCRRPSPKLWIPLLIRPRSSKQSPRLLQKSRFRRRQWLSRLLGLAQLRQRLQRIRGLRRRRGAWCRRVSGCESKNPTRRARHPCRQCRLVPLGRGCGRQTRSCHLGRPRHSRRQLEISRDLAAQVVVPVACRRALHHSGRRIHRRCGRT
jgi:hypothetical protein